MGYEDLFELLYFKTHLHPLGIILIFSYFLFQIPFLFDYSMRLLCLPEIPAFKNSLY